MAEMCTTCGRAIIGSDRCLYCGGGAFEKPRPELLHPRGSEERIFRPGASLGRFIGWALLTATSAVVLWDSSDPRKLAAVGALVLVGPLALLAYIARLALVKVTVDPKNGIRLARGTLIPWSEVESVDARGVQFAPDYALLRSMLNAIGELGSRIAPGFLGIAMILAVVLLGILVVLLAVISGLLVPILILLSPWHRRVVVRLRDGRELVWRDLGREDEFVRLYRARTKSTRRSIPGRMKGPPESG